MSGPGCVAAWRFGVPLSNLKNERRAAIVFGHRKLAPPSCFSTSACVGWWHTNSTSPSEGIWASSLPMSARSFSQPSRSLAIPWLRTRTGTPGNADSTPAAVCWVRRAAVVSTSTGRMPCAWSQAPVATASDFPASFDHDQKRPLPRRRRAGAPADVAAWPVHTEPLRRAQAA